MSTPEDVKGQIEDMLGDIIPPSSEDENEEGVETDASTEEGEAGEETEVEEESTVSEEAEGEVEEGEGGTVLDEKTPPSGSESEADETETPAADESPALSAAMKKIEALSATVEELTGKIAQGTQQEPPAAAPAADDTPGLETHDFVGDEDPQDIVDSKEKLNALLNKVYQAGAQASSEGVLKSIPQIVTTQVHAQRTLSGMVEDFYKEHKDLQGYKKLVGMTANEVYAENTDWEMSDIFDETAKRVRNALGLTKVEDEANPNPKPKKKKTNPSFVQPEGAREEEVTEQTTKLQKEINDIL